MGYVVLALALILWSGLMWLIAKNVGVMRHNHRHIALNRMAIDNSRSCWGLIADGKTREVDERLAVSHELMGRAAALGIRNPYPHRRGHYWDEEPKVTT